MSSIISNGPWKTVIVFGVALNNYTLPLTIVTDLGHITGPLWKKKHIYYNYSNININSVAIHIFGFLLY